jgi:uncharacterized protein
MRIITSAIFVATLLVLKPGSAKAQIVISEIYGGAASGGAVLNQEFVELYNNGTSSVDLTGWSIQYASSAGAFSASVTLSGSLAAGQVGIVRGQLSTGAASIPTNPNGAVELGTFGTAFSATSAKVALANNTDTVSSTAGQVTPGSGAFLNVVDFVGYGTAANQREGGATSASNTPAPSATTSVFRILSGSGLQDTNVNSADFLTAAPTPGVVPEPGSMILVGATCLTALGWRRFRTRAKVPA